MRTTSKPNAKPSQSRGTLYRAALFSACTDLEALVDAYGAEAIARMAYIIQSEIAEHGDAINNGLHNLELNALPIPTIRKQNQSRAELRAIRNKIAATTTTLKRSA